MLEWAWSICFMMRAMASDDYNNLELKVLGKLSLTLPGSLQIACVVHAVLCATEISDAIPLGWISPQRIIPALITPETICWRQIGCLAIAATLGALVVRCKKKALIHRCNKQEQIPWVPFSASGGLNGYAIHLFTRSSTPRRNRPDYMRSILGVQ